MEDNLLQNVPKIDLSQIKVEDVYTDDTSNIKIKEEPPDEEFTFVAQDFSEVDTKIDINSPAEFDITSSQNLPLIPECVIKEELQDCIDIDSEQDLSDNDADSNSEQPIHFGVHDSAPSFIDPVTNELTHVCLVCDKYFKRKKLLKAHMLRHDNTRCFQCPSCPQTFKTKTGLQKHKETHKLENCFKCSFCPESFSRLIDFKKHAATHPKPEYICDVCQKVCKSKGSLTVHRKCHSSELRQDGGFVKCSLCPMIFNNGFNLKRHAKVHQARREVPTGNGIFKCTLCPMIFSNSHDLQKHSKTHLPQMQYVCDFCQKSCKTERLLKLHLICFDETRKYQCPSCPSTFTRNSCFRHHKQKHERKFECSFCSKRFFSNFKLKVHTASHLPDKAEHTCDICKKVFPKKEWLMWHLKRHESKFYHCNVCQERFPSEVSISAHMKSHEYEFYIMSNGENGFVMFNENPLNPEASLNSAIQFNATDSLQCNVGQECLSEESLSMSTEGHESDIRNIESEEGNVESHESDLKNVESEKENAESHESDIRNVESKEENAESHESNIKNVESQEENVVSHESSIKNVETGEDNPLDIKKLLKSLIENRDESEAFLCKLCKKEFLSEELIVDHLMSHNYEFYVMTVESNGQDAMVVFEENPIESHRIDRVGTAS